ncbi:extracellular solute-binding protein [Sinorhizobium meliloti]|uniref:extracellular solute-binding protein n=1 Tax=Rhizobium meliloti TaxID=382 RepID=UPI000FD95C4A|nr:extracellular solute-binding protein [Sinorhizobium meliloti]RVK92343.1 extracellular solute-binding protein [Sinorhizobium meliloti]RVN44886.1 extracellular solute-binding protein [Sinorhizobium meliloti]
MKWSKHSGLVSIAALALSFSAMSAAAEPVTIRVSYSPASLKTLYETVAERFMEMYPEIEIELEAPAASYDELVQQTIMQSIVGQMPDISHQGLNQIRTLADRGLAVPLNDLINNDPKWDEIGVPEGTISYAAFGGETYGLPFAISVPVLYYNVDLIREAGGDPENLPTTWDDVFNLSRKIDAISPTVSGHYLEYTNNSWSFQTFLASFGGRMMSPDESQIEFNGDAGLRTLELLQDSVGHGQPALERDQARQAFGAGTLGILYTASSSLAGFERTASGKFEVKVGQFPVSSAAVSLPAAGNGIVMLTREPRKQEAAWQYMRFAIGEIGQRIMVETTGYTPVNVRALANPDGLGGFYNENPNYAVATESIESMTGWYSFPGENNSRIIRIIEDYTHEVVSGTREPASALADMTEEVAKLLPK